MEIDYLKNIKGLTAIGMNERGAKVYLALLKKINSTVSDLHKATGVKQNKLYEIVTNLMRDGYCIEKKIGKKRFFNAVDPKDVIGRALNRIEMTLKTGYELKEELALIYNSAEDVKELYESIDIIYGSDNLHNRYIEIMESSNKELFSLCRPPFAGVTEEKQKAQLTAYATFLKKGGMGRTIYEVNEDSPLIIFDILNEKSKKSGEFHIASKLPLKINIFDKEIVMIADKSSFTMDNELSMAVIKQRTSVEGYYALMEFLWTQSKTYDEWIVENKDFMERKLKEYADSLL
ncbi:MAG: hypothetical protein B6226_04165 [Candidatus Cloacimonetes bacterium 4572_65]|nr:MAG: hypothetical protein B6226_04165 [Candidatus Cloacimonetes bacterium 4572_65]